jgi:hypothetical protein
VRATDRPSALASVHEPFRNAAEYETGRRQEVTRMLCTDYVDILFISNTMDEKAITDMRVRQGTD